MAEGASPEALLLITSSCPHCATVLSGVCELLKAGDIAQLEVVNIDKRPALVERMGVRSVPWLRLGPFELEGLHSPAELRQWARRAGTEEGMAAYFRELLASGRLPQVVEILRREPAHFGALLSLLEDAGTELQVRIGIGAAMEEFAGSEALRGLLPQLGRLTRHGDARVRLDACHYLVLSAAPEAGAYLRACLQDADPAVREEAQEGLARL